MLSKYKVTYKIIGETIGYIPDQGKVLIELNEDYEQEKSLEEKIRTLISDVFNIAEERIIIFKVKIVKDNK
jgi:hypothetical protein